MKRRFRCYRLTIIYVAVVTSVLLAFQIHDVIVGL